MPAAAPPPPLPPSAGLGPWLLGLGLAALAVGPALVAGEAPGHGLTDLWPAIWAFDEAARAFPGVVTHTERLAAPAGMAVWLAAPLKAWLFAPFTLAFGAIPSFSLALGAARAATVGLAAWAARGAGRGPAGQWAFAIAAGAAPFWWGPAWEGIVEGVDGWALFLYLGAEARRRRGLAAAALGLCALSSWYLGAIAVFWLLVAAVADRRALRAAPGLLLAAPALLAFLHAFPGVGADVPGLHAAMGSLHPPEPPFWARAAPAVFGRSPWPGPLPCLLAVAAALRSRRATLLLGAAVLAAVLSTGRGPWWAFPVLDWMRFPDRFLGAALVGVAAAAARAVDALAATHPGRARLLLVLLLADALLLAPQPPALPAGGRPDTTLLSGLPPGAILLDLPGPLSLPPGAPNGSRARARAVLGAQLGTTLRSPFAPDFNGLAAADGLPGAPFGADPLLPGAPAAIPPDLIAEGRQRGIHAVRVRGAELGRRRAADLEQALSSNGFREIARDGPTSLWAWPEPSR